MLGEGRGVLSNLLLTASRLSLGPFGSHLLYLQEASAETELMLPQMFCIGDRERAAGRGLPPNEVPPLSVSYPNPVTPLEQDSAVKKLLPELSSSAVSNP